MGKMHAASSMAAAPGPDRPLRILIVEDESLLSLELEMMLGDWGYLVVASAANGEEGIRAALALRPDLVLMDINLGAGIDGITAAAAIRRDCGARIVLMTAYAGHDLGARLQGMDAPVLHKPIHPEILRRLLSQAADDLR